ncbi:MAG: mechanosensitive ion channel [Deltaproteobacteria bacterium]|nr:mechanosensitive ion channel [Deltaproteobacteria bacterium]
MTSHTESMALPETLFKDLLIFFGALLSGYFGARLVLRLVVRWARHTSTNLDDVVLRHLRQPLSVLIPLIVLRTVQHAIHFPPTFRETFLSVYAILLIIVLAWLFLRANRAIEEHVKNRFDLSQGDNLQARAIHTQISTLKNIVGFVVVLVAAASILMTFERVRQLGLSLLASAGVAGIVIGFAAQRSIATLLAGIQLALTQPIRIDDVVIVENEWGRIEEITLTYVVVRIWDLRRLVVPITYFIDKPFQNWTRKSAEILGTVNFYTDYTISVDEVRAELERLVSSSDLWDRKVCGLQVTDTSERTMTLRALVSASDSGKAWDLRCLVREKLVAFISKRWPESLPRTRAEIEGGLNPRAQAAATPPSSTTPAAIPS